MHSQADEVLRPQYRGSLRIVLAFHTETLDQRVNITDNPLLCMRQILLILSATQRGFVFNKDC